MKQQLLGLGLVVGLLGTGGFVGFSQQNETVQARQLQARWNQDEAQGVPATSLAPLRAALTRQETGGGVWANLDPWQVAKEMKALGEQTTGVEMAAYAASRQRALNAKTELARALGVVNRLQRQNWEEDLGAAQTPSDYDQLAVEWHLEAVLVPIDAQVARELEKMNALAAKVRALGARDVPAAQVNAAANDYADMGALLRGRLAGRVLGQIAAASATLEARLGGAQGAHDALASAAATITEASAAGVSVGGYQTSLAQAQVAYILALSVADFTAISNKAQGITNAAGAALEAAIASRTNVISGVSFYYQAHNLSCEETATSMALTHQGLHVSQDQILAALGVDWTPAVLSGGVVVSWGDPDKAFVGNVNGSERNYSGQQANPKALVRVLNAYGARIIEWSEPGVGPNVISAQEIYKQVLANHPVVAYATWDWQWHRIYYYTSEDGNRVPLVSPWEDHVYTVVGVSPNSVLVNDPIRGQYWVSKAAFEASYEFGMAIVLA
jgi:uncharacterized protein YvpB